MEFSRQEHQSGLSFPPPGDLPDLGIEAESLVSPALAGGFLITGATQEAHLLPVQQQKMNLLFPKSTGLLSPHHFSSRRPQ